MQKLFSVFFQMSCAYWKASGWPILQPVSLHPATVGSKMFQIETATTVG